jgi:F-type H+-transporting ATPase subunit gamma
LVDVATHPFLSGKAQPASSLVIVASSDRGLCGAFNAQVLKKVFEFLRQRSEHELRIVTAGRRAELAVHRAGYPLLASFEAISSAPSYERIRPIAELV